MSEPKPIYQSKRIVDNGGEMWVELHGSLYKRATRHEILAAQVAAEPVEDAVKVVAKVARLGERG